MDWFITNARWIQICILSLSFVAIVFQGISGFNNGIQVCGQRYYFWGILSGAGLVFNSIIAMLWYNLAH